MPLIKARELAIFATLRMHDLHGYAIAAAFKSGPFQLLGLTRAATYSILERFKKRGWLRSHFESAGNYPDREVLSLSASNEAFQHLKSESFKGDTLPVAPLMALALLRDTEDHIDPSVIQRLLSERVEIRTAWKSDVEHAKTHTMRLGLSYLDAEIAYLESLIHQA